MDMNLGVGLGANTPASVRRILNFTGTQYGTLDTPHDLAIGDTLEIPLSNTSLGVNQFIFPEFQLDAGNLLQLINGTMTIDGTVVADGADISSYRAGKLHVAIFTATAPVTIEYVAQDGLGGSLFIGQILHTKFTDKSGAEDVITNYVFDSGSTVEQFARGSDTLKVTLTNFTAANWSRYTLQRNITHDAGVIAEGWLGDNVVVSGRFDDGSAWTVDANWSIAEGIATHSVGATSSIYQNILTLGLPYLLKFDIPRMDAAFLRGYIGLGNFTQYTTTGTKKFFGTALTDTSIYIYADTACDADVDNVSVQHLLEVTQ